MRRRKCRGRCEVGLEISQRKRTEEEGGGRGRRKRTKEGEKGRRKREEEGDGERRGRREEEDEGMMGQRTGEKVKIRRDNQVIYAHPNSTTLLFLSKNYV